jgi:hypothetical protein
VQIDAARKWRGRPPSHDTERVAITPASAASSAANFFRSVVQWLQVGYPEGVPGPDRVALLELLRSTPLTEDEITEVVDSIDEEELSNGNVHRDVIADFISDMTHYDAGPENISRRDWPPPDGRCRVLTLRTSKRPRTRQIVEVSITKR